jgi:hypothetical protein
MDFKHICHCWYSWNLLCSGSRTVVDFCRKFGHRCQFVRIMVSNILASMKTNREKISPGDTPRLRTGFLQPRPHRHRQFDYYICYTGNQLTGRKDGPEQTGSKARAAANA